MSRAKEALFMGIGILAGIILSGPAAQAATTAITATLSTQAIYVDGQQVSMTAYAINGNNYVKLRDIGEAVDFNVYWDGKAVQIESDRPYTGEAPASQPSQPAKDSQGVGNGYLANGKPATEGNVLELLRQIEKDWPSGTVWGTHNTPGTYKNEVPSTEALRLMRAYGVNGYYACGGYASMISSLLFGDADNPARRVEDLSQIRPGDVIFFIVNDTGKPCHVTVALESPNGMNSFHYTDGNNGAAVYWPDAQHPYENEEFQHLGSVVTNHGYSDWATTAIPAQVKTMWYRFSRREDDYCIECSRDGERFTQMRVCHMWEGADRIKFGVYACSPENSSFTAIFTDMEITECKWLAHDGQAPDEE